MASHPEGGGKRPDRRTLKEIGGAIHELEQEGTISGPMGTALRFTLRTVLGAVYLATIPVWVPLGLLWLVLKGAIASSKGKEQEQYKAAEQELRKRFDQSSEN